MKPLNLFLSLCLIALTALAGQPSEAGEMLKITGDTNSVTIETDEGPVEIHREHNDTMLIGGVLQPMVPVPGVTPVGELEVLEALASRNAKVIDMRTIE